MGKPRIRSVLYRLIEAGQLARQALLVPLQARGLEPGDDAVLFLLRDPVGASVPEVSAALGTSTAALEERLRRLTARGLVERRPAGVVLTAEGERLHELLTDNWDQLEHALLGDMPKKRRRHLRKGLERVVGLLSF